MRCRKESVNDLKRGRKGKVEEYLLLGIRSLMIELSFLNALFETVTNHREEGNSEPIQ